MKNNFKYIYKKLSLFLLGIVALLSACSDPESFFSPVVEVNLPPHVPRLVIRADWEVNSDSVAIFVTKTRSTLDASPYNYYSFDTIANTKVEVLKNGQLIATIPYVYAGYHVAKGLFRIDSLGSTYTLRVSAPNFETVEASQVSRKLPTFNIATYRVASIISSEPLGGSTEKVDDIGLDIVDVADEQNYYEHSSPTLSYRDSSGRFYSQNTNIRSSDPLAEVGILNDNTFNGRTYRWRLETTEQSQGCYQERNGIFTCRAPKSGDRFLLTIRSVSRDWFLFKKSRDLLLDAQDNILFSEPVTLHTNVKNGYGIFSIYSRRRVTFTLP